MNDNMIVILLVNATTSTNYRCSQIIKFAAFPVVDQAVDWDSC